MALFKISKGLSENLPQTLTEGYCWYTCNDSKFYIDHKDENGVLVRKALNSEYAEKLRYVEDGDIIELNPSEIVTKTELSQALTGKANASHNHDDIYYTETEIDIKIENAIAEAKADSSNKDIVILTETQNGITAVQTALDNHVDNIDIHVTEAQKTAWSAAEQNAKDYTDIALSGKADASHNHDDIYYTETEIDVKIENAINEAKADASDKDIVVLFETQKSIDAIHTGLDNKVDKVNGKGLSTNDYTTAEKNKLAGIEDGAQVNVQSDWNQNDPDAPGYIENRTHWVENEQIYTIYTGTLGTAGAAAVKPAFLEMDEPLIEGDEYIVTLNGTTYTLTAAIDEYDCVYIGDNSYTFTLIPFKLYNDSDTSQTFEVNKNGDWDLTVKHHIKEIHQLDEKFIPDTIARVHNWTKIYDSGAITKKVNAFSNISLGDYTNIMVAIKAVNTTSSAGNTGGAITFVGQNTGNSYAFRNILPDLIKNTTGTTGGMAIFKIIDGFIICENAMRSTSAENMLSTTEAAGADNLVPVGGGVIACTDKIAWFYVGNTNSSKTHYYGAGSRIVVWGCKA